MISLDKNLPCSWFFSYMTPVTFRMFKPRHLVHIRLHKFLPLKPFHRMHVLALQCNYHWSSSRKMSLPRKFYPNLLFKTLKKFSPDSNYQLCSHTAKNPILTSWFNALFFMINADSIISNFFYIHHRPKKWKNFQAPKYFYNQNSTPVTTK